MKRYAQCQCKISTVFEVSNPFFIYLKNRIKEEFPGIEVIHLKREEQEPSTVVSEVILRQRHPEIRATLSKPVMLAKIDSIIEQCLENEKEDPINKK